MLIIDQERRGIVILENWDALEISGGSIFATKKNYGGIYDTYELGAYASDEIAQKVLYKILTQYREPDYQMPNAKYSTFFMPEK